MGLPFSSPSVLAFSEQLLALVGKTKRKDVLIALFSAGFAQPSEPALGAASGFPQ